MNQKSQDVIKKVMSESNGSGRPLVFRGMSIPEGDFSDLDLRQADFRGARIPFGKFHRTNLKYANFEAALLHGGQFIDCNCHRMSLKEADMSGMIFRPSDALGLTITLECNSFRDMEVDSGYWYGFIFYALLMKPPSEEERDRLIAFMGVERWDVLRRDYAVRQM